MNDLAEERRLLEQARRNQRAREQEQWKLKQRVRGQLNEGCSTARIDALMRQYQEGEKQVAAGAKKLEQLESQFAERERLEAMYQRVSEHVEKQLEERGKMLEQLEKAFREKQQAAPVYTNGSYLRDQLHPQNWSGFLDRTRPLPKGLDPSLALKEMCPFLSYKITSMINEGYGNAGW
jgi:DNA-binding transcriptional MerR regulator